MGNLSEYKHFHFLKLNPNEKIYKQDWKTKVICSFTSHLRGNFHQDIRNKEKKKPVSWNLKKLQKRNKNVETQREISWELRLTAIYTLTVTKLKTYSTHSCDLQAFLVVSKTQVN